VSTFMTFCCRYICIRGIDTLIVTEMCDFDGNISIYSEEWTTPHNFSHPSISATDIIEGLLKVADT